MKMKTKISYLIIIILFLSSCRFVKDFNSYQQLKEVNYENVYKCKKNEFWTLLYPYGSHYFKTDFFTDSMIYKKGIDSALFNRLTFFCDTFNRHGFGPRCWHKNNCFNVVAVGKMNNSNHWIRDSLKFYTNANSLIQFISPIDNFDKVIFYLEAHQYYFNYTTKKLSAIKKTENGYYCIGEKVISDCPSIAIRVLVFLSFDGKIIELKTGRKINNHCCI